MAQVDGARARCGISQAPRSLRGNRQYTTRKMTCQKGSEPDGARHRALPSRHLCSILCLLADPRCSQLPLRGGHLGRARCPPEGSTMTGRPGPRRAAVWLACCVPRSGKRATLVSSQAAFKSQAKGGVRSILVDSAEWHQGPWHKPLQCS